MKPNPIADIAVYKIIVERKITTIAACDWFKIVDPTGWHPDIGTWWNIIKPTEWAGVKFHIDTYSGVGSVFKFHMDKVKGPVPAPPTPPPWNVTAELMPDPWYWKPSYTDYVPSGMPDFDQRQWGTYNWTNGGAWSHCGPVACANSLWWLDSEFEPHPVPPPPINDGFPLVRTYGQWDDHDPRNVQPLVEHLAFLMDTDGRRTVVLPHSGTNVFDMEAGLSQYLSWTGINPLGDVNGDGVVDQLDINIVNSSMGSHPGMANWTLTADIFPASMTYPPIADNVVDQNDLNLVMTNIGRTGRFYEHTVLKPTFDYVEEEVKKCQDVVLLIGYWYYSGGTWYREPGAHYVTVAGIDSEDLKIALSDPVNDAFETGLTPEGRVPIPHPHMPPEPPYTMHNDAAYVSQDIYNVTWISPPFMPPCPGGNWTLINFAHWSPTPPFFAVIEYAVVTSPLGVHDVAVTDVASTKEGCLPMPNVGQNQTVRVNILVENQGDFTETFNVTAYAANLLNTYSIGTQQVTLDANTSTTITIVWNTLGFARSNYTLSATADTVPGETETADNTHNDGTIWVNLIGDINCDDYVGIDDIFTIASHFAQDPSHPNWNPNCDLNDDDYIGIDDIFMAASHFGEEGP